MSYLTPSPALLPNRVFFAVALSLPILAIARLGHFGAGQWSFPTVPGQIYLIWNLGLLPSLAAAASHSRGVYPYESAAKWVGASGFLIWFLAFSIGAGRARRNHDRSGVGMDRLQTWSRSDALGLVVLTAVWLGCGVVAARLNALSSWTQINIADLQGSAQGAAMIFYWAFIPVIPVLGLTLLQRARGKWRGTGIAILTLGSAALVAFSNRRLIVYLVVLILFLFYRNGLRVSFKRVLVLGLAAGTLMGPLLWPIRIAATHPELFRSDGHPVQMLGEAVTRYVGDPQFRKLVSETGSENLQEGRFNYADTYLAGVQWTLDHGASHSPSFFY
ncbi:MAG TPA: hypothetical protein VFT46_10265, partial [Holophagaceae bacterium]|nr:hypothetical protein [Holophagaceae bacterium]